MKIRKNKNTITTQIKRSELLSRLSCIGGSTWRKEEDFDTDWTLKEVNTAIADLLSYQNLYGFYPDRDYEVKLTKRQMDLMFVFYSYINKGKFNDAYHELWDSIEKSWETYSEDDYLAYDELVAIYGLLFTFKLAVELADLKTSYQNTKDKLILENSQLKADLLRYKDKEDKEQEALAKRFEEGIDIRSSLLFLDDDNEDIVQIDIEKEFNQMVKDYNQFLENPFCELNANCKSIMDNIFRRIIDDILMPDFWKESSVEFLYIIFLAIIHTDTQHRTFADVIKLLSTANFDKNDYMDKDCDLAKLLINFRNLYSQSSKEYEQCEAILNIPKATFKPIKQIMIDKLSPYKDEVVE